MTAKAASPKRKPSPKVKPRPKRAAKPPASSSRPFLRFYYPEGLHKKTLSVLDRIEKADDATALRDALADVVVELTNSGLDFYFLKPLEHAKAGFILEKAASVGMAAAQQVMASVIRQIIGRMESPQLLSVCGSIRQLMR
jgi:hypothetical protein